MNVRFDGESGLRYELIISRLSPVARQRFRLRVKQALRRISQFPLSGRLTAEFPEHAVRQFLVENYRFFYVVNERLVRIVGVWHVAQQPHEPSRVAP